MTPKASPETFTLWVSSDAGFPAGSLTKNYSGLEVLSLTPPDSLRESVVHYWKVEAIDGVGNSTGSAVWTVTYIDYLCGDADGDYAELNIADLIYMVNYMLQDGPAPAILESIDVNGSGGDPDIADLVALVTFMFQDGPDLDCP